MLWGRALPGSRTNRARRRRKTIRRIVVGLGLVHWGSSGSSCPLQLIRDIAKDLGSSSGEEGIRQVKALATPLGDSIFLLVLVSLLFLVLVKKKTEKPALPRRTRECEWGGGESAIR